MIYKQSALVKGLIAAVFLVFLYIHGVWGATADNVSGVLINGFRVLSVGEFTGDHKFLVFRGDYIKFDLGSKASIRLSIPALDIENQLTRKLDPVPYFKMKQAGLFDIFIDDTKGVLEVLEYSEAHYLSVSAAQAQAVIENFSPLILDVRTAREYKQARIKGAVLLPVQELQKRWAELSSHKDDPILIYCATGNRSIVASKILIDRGFTRIFNLRNGIVDWYKRKYPVKQ